MSRKQSIIPSLRTIGGMPLILHVESPRGLESSDFHEDVISCCYIDRRQIVEKEKIACAAIQEYSVEHFIFRDMDESVITI